MDELIQRLRSDGKALFSAGWVKTSDLAREAADAIEQLTADLERSKEWEGFWKEQAEEAKGKLQQYALAVANKPRWIPVTERLPQETQRCIVVSKCGEIGFAISTGEDFMLPYYFGKPTHWIPLPEPPKEE